jgi:DNA-binding PadR family transcriptional regulator
MAGLPESAPSPGEASLYEADTPPLTEAGYLILLSLAGGATHGYRIMQVINDVFRTDLRMGPGTLYRTLQRLMTDGLIEEVEASGEDDADAERRRAYRLSGRGLAAARGEMRRLEVLVRLAKAQLPGAR